MSDLEFRDQDARTGPLDRPARPPCWDETRPYGRRYGLERSAAEDQAVFAAGVRNGPDGRPERFPCLNGRWVELLNDGGPLADPRRGNNCRDCTTCGISTWWGEPVMAAPRSPDYGQAGQALVWHGELDGRRRAVDWYGVGAHELVGTGPEAYAAIEATLRRGGHGSCADIVHYWTHGGSHAWAAFNRHGEVHWVDFQTAQSQRRPIHADVDEVLCIAMDREGNRL